MVMGLQGTRRSFAFRALSFVQAAIFIFSSFALPAKTYAQSVMTLPVPGAMVSPSDAYVPTLLRGMTLHMDNPFRFDFIVDNGNSAFAGEDLKKESKRLVDYFLASMTVPSKDLWVNLSPVEKDRIIPEALGATELGQDLLAQDYILKQLTSTLMYPEADLGKAFWSKIYEQAKAKYGVTDIPTDTFNKVWIMPDRATIYENGARVYVVGAKLKVMLDQDRMAQKELGTGSEALEQGAMTAETATVMREVVLPAIEREVNTGKNFAPLRQIYYSLILAKWYKEKVRNSILTSRYIDQSKVKGIDMADPAAKEKIYARYLEAYKKGVYNYIKEDYDAATGETVPRKYFSGGFIDDAEMKFDTVTVVDEMSTVVGDNSNVEVDITPGAGIEETQIKEDLSLAEEAVDLQDDEQIDMAEKTFVTPKVTKKILQKTAEVRLALFGGDVELMNTSIAREVENTGRDPELIKRGIIGQDYVPEIKSGYLHFRVDEFNNELDQIVELIQAITRALHQPMPAIASAEAGVQWLNASIEPYKLLFNAGGKDLDGETMGLVASINKEYGVKSIDLLTDEQLTALAATKQGERLKRAILEIYYPLRVPKSLKTNETDVMMVAGGGEGTADFEKVFIKNFEQEIENEIRTENPTLKPYAIRSAKYKRMRVLKDRIIGAINSGGYDDGGHTGTLRMEIHDSKNWPNEVTTLAGDIMSVVAHMANNKPKLIAMEDQFRMDAKININTADKNELMYLVDEKTADNILALRATLGLRFRLSEFNANKDQIKELITLIMKELGQRVPDNLKSYEDQIQWLNNSIEPYRLLKNIEERLSDAETINLIAGIQKEYGVKSMGDLTDKQLSRLVGTAQGQRLKRNILKIAYPLLLTTNHEMFSNYIESNGTITKEIEELRDDQNNSDTKIMDRKTYALIKEFFLVTGYSEFSVVKFVRKELLKAQDMFRAQPELKPVDWLFFASNMIGLAVIVEEYLTDTHDIKMVGAKWQNLLDLAIKIDTGYIQKGDPKIHPEHQMGKLYQALGIPYGYARLPSYEDATLVAILEGAMLKVKRVEFSSEDFELSGNTPEGLLEAIRRTSVVNVKNVLQSDKNIKAASSVVMVKKDQDLLKNFLSALDLNGRTPIEVLNDLLRNPEWGNNFLKIYQRSIAGKSRIDQAVFFQVLRDHQDGKELDLSDIRALMKIFFQQETPKTKEEAVLFRRDEATGEYLITPVEVMPTGDVMAQPLLSKNTKRIALTASPLELELAGSKVVFKNNGNELEVTIDGRSVSLSEEEPGKTILRSGNEKTLLPLDVREYFIKMNNVPVTLKSRMVEEQTFITDEILSSRTQEIIFKQAKKDDDGKYVYVQDKKSGRGDKLDKSGSRKVRQFQFFAEKDKPVVSRRVIKMLRGVKRAFSYGETGMVTSLLPNLLVKGVVDEIYKNMRVRHTKGIFFPKITTDFETKDLSLREQIMLLDSSIKAMGASRHGFSDLITDIILPNPAVWDQKREEDQKDIKKKMRNFLRNKKLQEDIENRKIKISKYYPMPLMNFTEDDIAYLKRKGIRIHYLDKFILNQKGKLVYDRDALYKTSQQIMNFKDGIKVEDNFKPLTPVKSPKKIVRVLFKREGFQQVRDIEVPAYDLTTDPQSRTAAARRLLIEIYNRLTIFGGEEVQVATDDNDLFNETKELLYNPALSGQPKDLGYYALAKFAEHIYSKEFQFNQVSGGVLNDEVSTTIKTVGKVNTDGVWMGLDIGGSDVKAVMMKDGKLITKANGALIDPVIQPWSPKGWDDPKTQHIPAIKKVLHDLINKVKAENPSFKEESIQGVGVSINLVVVDNQIKGMGPVVNSVPKENMGDMWALDKVLSEEFDLPVYVLNDGDAMAYQASVDMGLTDTLALSGGTGLATGYGSTQLLTEGGNVIIDLDAEADGHSYTQVKGAAQKYISQRPVFRLAEKAGLQEELDRLASGNITQAALEKVNLVVGAEIFKKLTTTTYEVDVNNLTTGLADYISSDDFVPVKEAWAKYIGRSDADDVRKVLVRYVKADPADPTKASFKGIDVIRTFLKENYPFVQEKYMAVFKLATNESEQLEYLQDLYDIGDSRAIAVFSELPKYLAAFVKQLAKFLTIKNVIIGGRITKGESGRYLIEEAQKLLGDKITIQAPKPMEGVSQELYNQVGQAIGATYYAADKKNPVDQASNVVDGGIDLQQIAVDKQAGSSSSIEFSPEVMAKFMDVDIQAISPVIINITPVPSILPLLGLTPSESGVLGVAMNNAEIDELLASVFLAREPELAGAAA
jgi:predicted NBD/HSP70 family sugar kinase